MVWCLLWTQGLSAPQPLPENRAFAASLPLHGADNTLPHLGGADCQGSFWKNTPALSCALFLPFPSQFLPVPLPALLRPAGTRRVFARFPGSPPSPPSPPLVSPEAPDTSPLGSLGPPAPLLRFPRSPWHHTAAPWPYLPWFPREPLTLPRVLWDPQHLCSGSPGAPGATLLPPCPQALRASGAFPGSRLLFGPKSKVLFLDVGLPEPGTLPCSSLDMVGALLIQSGPWDSPEQAPGGPLLSWV